MESLTTGPELENSQGHSATCRTVWAMSVFAPTADIGCHCHAEAVLRPRRSLVHVKLARYRG